MGQPSTFTQPTIMPIMHTYICMCAAVSLHSRLSIVSLSGFIRFEHDPAARSVVLGCPAIGPIYKKLEENTPRWDSVCCISVEIVWPDEPSRGNFQHAEDKKKKGKSTGI